MFLLHLFLFILKVVFCRQNVFLANLVFHWISKGLNISVLKMNETRAHTSTHLPLCADVVKWWWYRRWRWACLRFMAGPSFLCSPAVYSSLLCFRGVVRFNVSLPCILWLIYYKPCSNAYHIRTVCTPPPVPLKCFLLTVILIISPYSVN